MTNQDRKLFVVCEGVAYAPEEAPEWLNQNNWMCDWMFVGAYSEDDAVAVAEAVDEASNQRRGRAYNKADNIMNLRAKILREEEMSPVEIYRTQGGRINSERLQFNQDWIKIRAK